MAVTFLEQRQQPIGKICLDQPQVLQAHVLEKGDVQLPGHMRKHCTQGINVPLLAKQYWPSLLRRRHSFGGFVPYQLARAREEFQASLRSRAHSGPCAPSAPAQAEVTDGSRSWHVTVVGGASPAAGSRIPELRSRLETRSSSQESRADRICSTSTIGHDLPDIDTEDSSLARSDRGTTVSIRNLPSTCLQCNLIAELDSTGFKAKYDFCHVLPANADSKSSRFAIVNFVDAETALRCVQTWNGLELLGMPSTGVVLAISTAETQGLDWYLQKFARSRMRRHRRRDWMPFVATPATDVVA